MAASSRGRAEWHGSGPNAHMPPYPVYDSPYSHDYQGYSRGPPPPHGYGTYPGSHPSTMHPPPPHHQPHPYGGSSHGAAPAGPHTSSRGDYWSYGDHSTSPPQSRGNWHSYPPNNHHEPPHASKYERSGPPHMPPVTPNGRRLPTHNHAATSRERGATPPVSYGAAYATSKRAAPRSQQEGKDAHKSGGSTSRSRSSSASTHGSDRTLLTSSLSSTAQARRSRSHDSEDQDLSLKSKASSMEEELEDEERREPPADASSEQKKGDGKDGDPLELLAKVSSAMAHPKSKKFKEAQHKEKSSIPAPPMSPLQRRLRPSPILTSTPNTADSLAEKQTEARPSRHAKPITPPGAVFHHSTHSDERSSQYPRGHQYHHGMAGAPYGPHQTPYQDWDGRSPPSHHHHTPALVERSSFDSTDSHPSTSSHTNGGPSSSRGYHHYPYHHEGEYQPTHSPGWPSSPTGRHPYGPPPGRWGMPYEGGNGARGYPASPPQMHHHHHHHGGPPPPTPGGPRRPVFPPPSGYHHPHAPHPSPGYHPHHYPSHHGLPPTPRGDEMAGDRYPMEVHHYHSAETPVAYAPYTYVQQSRLDEKTVLKKKFSWKHHPELERFLIENRDDYLKHSSRNYTIEQKQFNNHLTERLLEVAEKYNYVFDPEDFNFVAIRDRIRCYYKSYVQTARKRGLQLPTDQTTDGSADRLAKKSKDADGDREGDDGTKGGVKMDEEEDEDTERMDEDEDDIENNEPAAATTAPKVAAE